MPRKLKTKDLPSRPYAASGTQTDWYKGWDLTDEEREVYRRRSRESQKARLRAEEAGAEPAQEINQPKLDPLSLMPKRRRTKLTALSLFSGGGGLDLGFDLAGFKHVASYEILDFAAETLRANRRRWKVFGGDDGDVTRVDWSDYAGGVDVIHGGPPCQPFSTAGRQVGKADVRDMFPEFVRAVLAIRPRAFVAENVPGLTSKKFSKYLDVTVHRPLAKHYQIKTFKLTAASYGVPQRRTRLVFVGIADPEAFEAYAPPEPTHDWRHLAPSGRNGANQTEMFGDLSKLERCMGAREALGLPDTGIDELAPTIRSTLTGPRHTTSIVSSTNAVDAWTRLGIWPNGVGLTREKASVFPTKNGTFRLAVADCATLQGFPEAWTFTGPVYKALGQIGNSVAPPMAYRLARSLQSVLR